MKTPSWTWERSQAYFKVVRSGLGGNPLTVRKKLLPLQPLPHYRGNVLVERFLGRKDKEGNPITKNVRKKQATQTLM